MDPLLIDGIAAGILFALMAVQFIFTAVSYTHLTLPTNREV